jgi:hypothetical protein
MTGRTRPCRIEGCDDKHVLAQQGCSSTPDDDYELLVDGVALALPPRYCFPFQCPDEEPGEECTGHLNRENAKVTLWALIPQIAQRLAEWGYADAASTLHKRLSGDASTDGPFS